MAYNALNNLIDAYIYANGVQAITGSVLNGVLKAMVAQLGEGYHIFGVATPSTRAAINDEPMAYFAATAGTYLDFGGITLDPGEVAVLLTSGNGVWAKQTIYTVPTDTGDLTNEAGFITAAVSDLVNYYTKTEMDLELGEIDSALENRYTKAETDTKLGDYYRKAETYDKDEVDSIIATLSRQEYIVAWDGLAAPDVSAIPAGVTVSYSGTTYTGTLAASASTVNKIYMVWNGTAYDMYGTTQDGGYSWVPMGTTTVDLSQYATKSELNQLTVKVDEFPSLYADAELTGNVFDNSTMADKQPGYFLGMDGELAIDANSAVSGRIPITENTEYVYHDFASGTAYLCFYDANGTALTPLRANGVPYDRKYLLPSEVFITPEGTRYALVTTKFVGTSYANDISIYEGTTDEGYLPYEKHLPYSELPEELITEVTEIGTALDQKADAADLAYKADLEDVPISRNLFDKTKMTQGWIAVDDGRLVTEDGPIYQVSDLIPVAPNTGYYITFANGLSSKALRFLEEDETPIQALNPDGTSVNSWVFYDSAAIKSPATAKYVQFQVLFNNTGDANATQFEVGSVPTPHQDYEVIKLLKEDELPLSVQELLGDGVKRNKLSLNVSPGGLSSVVSPFNSTNDLKMTFFLNPTTRNRVFNWDAYYFVNKSTSAETLAKSADDDICPELLGGGADYIGAAHGCFGLAYCTCAGHNKTVADIGSRWTNGTNNFTIVGIDTSRIYLIGDNQATYPDWDFARPGATDTFTHISGATHTEQFTITARSISQWLPICRTISRRVFLDGVEVLQSGEYSFDEMQVVELYNILNPADVLLRVQNGVGTFTQNPVPTDFSASAVVISHAITYTFTGADVNFISTNTTYHQTVSFDHFGFTQCIELPADNGLKLYIPKAKSKNNGADAVDFRTIVDASEGTGSIRYNDFEVTSRPPDRMLQFNPEVGIMIGYLPDYGVGGPNREAALVNHTAYYQSNAGLKMYPYGISGNVFADGYESYSAVCFKTFIDRAGINTGGVISRNVFEYNGRCYLYGDFNASGIYEFVIPEKYYGHRVTVYEKRENVLLLDEIATDRVRVRVNQGVYGYFVAYID